MGRRLAERVVYISRAAAQTADCCTECSISRATATSDGGLLHGMQHFSRYGHFRRQIVVKRTAFHHSLSQHTKRHLHR